MKRAAFFLLACYFFSLFTRAYAQNGNESRPGPVILTDEQDEYPLGRHIEILEDPGGELTIEEVASPQYATRFVPSGVEVPSFGYSASAYWVRLSLRSESALTENWLLVVNFENMHFVDFYSPSANGDGFEVTQTGAMRPPSTREIPYPRLAFTVTPPDQSVQTYYLRFENGAPMVLSLTLWQPTAFFSDSLRLRVPEILFYGVMVGLLLYNAFLSASLRDVNYLYLAALLASAVLYEVGQTSLLEIYLVPSLYQYKTQIIGLSSAAIMASLILFFSSFLGARTIMPNIYRLGLLLMGFAVLLGLATFVFGYHQVAVVFSPTIALIIVFTMTTVVLAWQRGFQAARFLLFAMLGLLACMLVFMLARMNVIPVSAVTENLFRFGFVWMAIGSSLALADRINLLKLETEQANRELLYSEQRLSQTLEAMPVGVVVYGPDQKPNYINRRTAEILTNPERGIGPRPRLERILPEAMNYYAFRFSGSDEAYPLKEFPVYRALQGEASHADDIEADLVDRRVQLEAWASPVFDETGEVESAVIAFQDVTARKQAEEALLTSEKKFRVVVDNNFDGIIFMDRDRKLLYVSPSYEQLNGIKAEELIGQSGIGFVHPDDRAHTAEVFQEVLQQPGQRFSTEYRIKHQNGSWIWIETNAINLLDDARVKAVVLNSRDITERKQTETALAEYRQHLERLVEQRTQELEAINEQLSSEVAERTLLEGVLQKRINWMSAVSSARQKTTGTADLSGIYENLLQTIMQLLDARSAFLSRWDRTGEQVVFLCHLPDAGEASDSLASRDIFAKDAPLRRELELGQIVTFSADEVEDLPSPLQDCFKEDGTTGSLLLVPMAAGESLRGVLGVVLPESLPGFMAAEHELLTKITLDLVTLYEYAVFLDSSRSLVAAEERNRLARDLHDSVTQVLFSASLVAEVLPQIWRRDPEKAMQSLDELRRLTRGALAEMRTMLLELRPHAVVKSPLHELLSQLTEATTTRAGLPFMLFIEQTPQLPADVHTAIYRIAQEALNNVAKHADASSVTLSFRAMQLPKQHAAQHNVAVQLVIEDDGVGFSPEDGMVEHLGLGIMRERAQGVKANLDIKSQIGEGTRVVLDWCGEIEVEDNE